MNGGLITFLSIVPLNWCQQKYTTNTPGHNKLEIFNKTMQILIQDEVIDGDWYNR